MTIHRIIASILVILMGFLLSHAQPVAIECQGETLWVHPHDNHESSPWAGYAQKIENADSPNDGRANTLAATQQIKHRWYATMVCNNLSAFGFDDWYLPSKEELNALYQQKEAIGGFSDHLYWSSTASGNNYDAWKQDFKTGEVYEGSRDFFHYIRCVRR